ncbi:trypsin-like serine protease [Clostridium bovifaecis]|uniref:Trypsin-like serine protease n=1 Tax=Clostridium bovifaecis TaxID=2184719 RepID=A0A6I6EW86_9CLOT|nr:trypsin-like serine protease [Clostridium bovifaecis]
MQENNYEVKEVDWENIAEEKYGSIKFRRRRSSVKRLFKAVALIAIAALSGAVTSSYIVEKRYSEEAKVKMENKDKQENFAETPYGSIAKVAEVVGPTVVGIIRTSPDILGNIDKSSGSGIIFDSNGYIVTNYHVIEGADEINVKLPSGQNYLKAKFIGSDTTSDLAIIKIDAQNLPAAKFGDSSKIRVGDLAIAIGNPIGEEFAGTVTAGIISALNRKIQYGGSIYRVLQTDAAINPGNSGGALCNEEGEIIGINSLKLRDSQYDNVEGIGFAIAINEAKSILDEIMKYGRVARPRLGIYGRDAVSEDSNGIKGVYVSGVIKGSGAEKAGVKPTDILIEIEGKKIVKFEDMSEILEKHKIGDSIKCKVWRNGKNIDMTIVLADIKNDKTVNP